MHSGLVKDFLCETINSRLFDWQRVCVSENSVRPARVPLHRVGYDYIEMENAGAGALNDGATPIASTPAVNADAIDLHPNYTGDPYMRDALVTKLTAIKATYFG